MSPERYYSTPRIHDHYALSPDAFRSSHFEDVWAAGLDQEVAEGIAYVEEVDGYHIALLPQIASHSPYGCLVYLFPNEEQTIRHGLHEYGTSSVPEHVLGFATDFASAIGEVAQEREELPVQPRVVINQHVGGFETTDPYFFSTTTKHTHFHIFTQDEEVLRNHPDLYVPSAPPDTYGERFLRHDPFLPLAKSILQRHFPEAEELRNGGIKVTQHNQDHGVQPLAKDWKKLMRAWYKEWHEIAEVFTSFTEDDNARYVPRATEAIADRLESYLSRADSLDISTHSKRILSALGRYVLPSTGIQDPARWFFKGPSGLIAFRRDPNNPHTELAVYPRVRVTTDKSAFQMHEFRTLKQKDRRAMPMSIAKAEDILRSIVTRGMESRNSQLLSSAGNFR